VCSYVYEVSYLLGLGIGTLPIKLPMPAYHFCLRPKLRPASSERRVRRMEEHKRWSRIESWLSEVWISDLHLHPSRELNPSHFDNKLPEGCAAQCCAGHDFCGGLKSVKRD